MLRNKYKNVKYIIIFTSNLIYLKFIIEIIEQNINIAKTIEFGKIL
jgi:hypothetical protein